MNLAWKIIVIVLVLGAVIFAVTRYRENKASYDGAITWTQGKPSDAEAAAFARKNAGEDETSPARTLDVAATSGSTPVSSAAPAAVAPVAAHPEGFPAALPAAGSDVPSTNSQPNAPDGYRFGGNGKYEFYRQGDLTFRLDTTNGHTCIVFATLEQWRKPLVMSRGCANAS